MGAKLTEKMTRELREMSFSFYTEGKQDLCVGQRKMPFLSFIYSQNEDSHGSSCLLSAEKINE